VKYIEDKIIKGILSWKELLITLYLIISSGNPYFRENSVVITVIGFSLLILLYPMNFKLEKNDVIPLFIICFFTFFEVLHKFIFNIDNEKAIFKIFGFFLFSYYTIKAIKIKFIPAYVNTIYLLSIISLSFYALLLIFPNLYLLKNVGENFFPLKHSTNPTIIFYTFDNAYYIGTYNYIRNAGFTWEAGGFATYLNIAFFFHISTTTKNFYSFIKDKKTIIFIISIISTFSTAGYLAFFFCLTYAIIKFNNRFDIIWLLFLLILSYQLFYKIEFLGNKIQDQIEFADETQNRIGAALLDWQDIKKRPFLGWSRKEKVLFGDDAYTIETHRPNGITNFIRRYGLIYFTTYLLIIFISFKNLFYAFDKKYYKIKSILLLFIILVMGFSQLIFDDFLFRSFLFLFIIKKSK